MIEVLRPLLFSFRLKLSLAILKIRSIHTPKIEYDIVFVIPPKKAPGWILKAICLELQKFCHDKKTVLVNSGKKLPSARFYFFSHYMYYFDAILKLRISNPLQGYVWATHLEPDKNGIDLNQLASLLNNAKKIFCMNSQLIKLFTDAGVNKSRMLLTIGAADPTVFLGHSRKPNGKVGFCSAFYERKSPEIVYEICTLIKDKEIVLIGKGWEKFDKFKQMMDLPNFEYVDTEYHNYPDLYASMSVFVSVSNVEGGPIPLLEAMISNVVPVVGDTGFSKDIVLNGINGYIYNLSSTSPMEIVELIYKAYDLKGDIRETVLQYDWESFSKNILKNMQI